MKLERRSSGGCPKKRWDKALNRNLMLIVVGIWLSGMSNAWAQRQDDAPIPFVFTQMVEGGTFDGTELTVFGVSKATPYLSDQPERTLQGKTENKEFAKAWDAPGTSSVPATLTLGDGNTFPLRLLAAQLNSGGFRYAVQADAMIPSEFGAATLAIELNGCIIGCSEMCPFNFSRVFFNKLVPCKP